MFKFTDPEKLKGKVLEASKWLTVQEFCQRAPEVNDLLLLERVDLCGIKNERQMSKL